MYLASVEVDQRQKFIQQADTLKEMIGASRLISLTVDWEEEIRKRHKGVEAVQTVSGVLRMQARDAGVLGRYLWELRSKLEEQGLSASIAVIEQTRDLDADLGRLETAIRTAKDAKGGAEGRPSLPYFARCRMLPEWPANYWKPGSTDGRELVSWRAQARKKTHVRYRGDGRHGMYWGLHLDGQPMAEDMDDLAPGEADSYIGIVKADVDGLGSLLLRLRYEELGKRLGVSAAEAVLRFSKALNTCVVMAVQKSLDTLNGKGPGRHYPFLPLIVAGDDLLILAQRHLALDLVSLMSEEYRREVAADGDLQTALEVAQAADGKAAALTLSFGVLFVKKGFPFEASLELTEELIKGAKEKRAAKKSTEGYVDFHWLGSSAREDLAEQRQKGETYFDAAAGKTLSLCTRPWALSVLRAGLDGAKAIAKFPARKLHQLDPMARLGQAASELAFGEWLRRLEPVERKAFLEAREKFTKPAGEGLWEPEAVDQGKTVARTSTLELLLMRDTKVRRRDEAN